MNTPNGIDKSLNGTEKELWRKSAIAEVNNFLKRKYWLIRSKAKLIQAGRNPIGFKWVFKKKNETDGSRRNKSRVVTLVYMQIPGADYTESFSPVDTATTFRTGIAITLYFDG